MDVDLTAYKDLFLQTAQDYATQIRNAVKELSANPADHSAVESIHIAAHSLKSQNLAMGYATNGNMFLVIEKTFARLLDEKKPVSNELQHALIECINKYESSLEQINNQNKETDLSYLTERMKKYE